METILEQWFAISQDDLDVARHCLTDFYPKKLAIACYHSQQSAEKALKAFLVYCGIEPPKTHDLRQLCEMGIEQDVSFNEACGG
jgi:HEPN domain-containing protein